MRALYICNALTLVGGLVYGMYYGTFLYEHTFSLSVLALDGLFGGLGAWFGYLGGVVLVRRYGYAVCLRTAFASWVAVALLTAGIANHIAEWFGLLAVLKALPAGAYGAATDTMLLRDVGQTAREGFLQAKLALEFAVTIILPTLLGALVSHAGGYQTAFVAAGAIYAVGLVVPVRLPKPELELQWRAFAAVCRRPLYLPQATTRTLAAGFNQLNGFMGTIIPFLLLKSELKMGLLTSGIALFGAIVALNMRRVKPTQRVKLGFGAYTLRGMGALAFVCWWSAPLLLVWQLVNKLMTPLHDPLQQGLDIQNDGLVLGEALQRQALTINVLNNTLLLMGSTVAYGLFYLILQASPTEQKLILQVLILTFAGWRMLNLLLSLWIKRQAAAGAVVPGWGWVPQLALVPVRRFANQQVLKVALLFAD